MPPPRRSSAFSFMAGSKSQSSQSNSSKPRHHKSDRSDKSSSSSTSTSTRTAPSPPPSLPPRSSRPLPPPRPPPEPAPRSRPRGFQFQFRPARIYTSPLPQASTILLSLVAFRLLNALVVRTFFQPDEYFQSLEPAWQLAFGSDKGAWMTWEWRNHLRSSLHPLLFAAVYRVVDFLALLLRLSSGTHAQLLIVTPKTLQAVIAAFGDYYTWKLSRRVYGDGSRKTWAVLVLTVVSPWQWFCSTRTLSNCLETTITVVALELWPWEWSLASARRSRNRDPNRNLTRLRQCLCLAALACILRPTNVLIWVTLASLVYLHGTWDAQKTLIREVLICGSVMSAVAAPIDRLFYGVWTFPPVKFLYYNVAQSLAIFYGANDFHYYVSQGLPLLLTTALPFALIGLHRAASRAQPSYTIQHQLALVCLVMPVVLSLISHKEVRFIYPLLPSLHVLAAPPLVEYFYPVVSRSSRAYTPRRLILVSLILANALISLYTTIYHASGTISILSYLREQHDRHAAPLSAVEEGSVSPGISAGFLMPCHSTPWRSHMVYPTINAWALTCEPPVHLNKTEKATYVDEADQFYADPTTFLRANMFGGTRHLPRKPSYLSTPLSPRQRQRQQQYHPWPDYLIFFAQLESTLQAQLRSSSYAECHRTFNTAWHDDWRRKGDVVVWCLDPEEQLAWRSVLRERVLRSHQPGVFRRGVGTAMPLIQGGKRSIADAASATSSTVASASKSVSATTKALWTKIGKGKGKGKGWEFPSFPSGSGGTWGLPWSKSKKSSTLFDYKSWKAPAKKDTSRRWGSERDLWS